MVNVNYISEEDIKEITSISKNVEASLLVPYIRSSEAMQVEPILGTALNSELKAAITGNTLTGVNYNLVQFYIKPLSVWATYLSAIPFLAFKGTSKGVVRQNSDNSQIASIEELTFLRQAVKDQVAFYKDQLQDYLEENSSLFANYRSCNTDTNYNSNGNGIYLGFGD